MRKEENVTDGKIKSDHFGFSPGLLLYTCQHAHTYMQTQAKYSRYVSTPGRCSQPVASPVKDIISNTSIWKTLTQNQHENMDKAEKTGILWIKNTF